MNHLGDKLRIDSAENKFDLAIEVVLTALLIFMPLAFGAVHAWSELVFISAAGVIAILFAIKVMTDSTFRFVWSWSYVAVAIFILLVILQLFSLPASFIEFISPNTAAVKTDLLGQIPGSNTDNLTLSFYPWATNHGLRLITALGVIFIIIVNTYRNDVQIKRLLFTIMLVGSAIALIAILQIISGTDKIYWQIPSGHRLADAGTFVNHSHFSQFINLSAGAGLGFLFIHLHTAFKGRKVHISDIFDFLGSRDGRICWVAVVALVLCGVGVFLSLSRGGALSMLIAGAITSVLLSTRRTAVTGKGWIMAGLALASFACVLYIGFDAVYDRLATVRDIGEYKGRWQIIKDISVAWTQFPIFGTGLGTHQYVYPMFDRSVIARIASHAENEYAQAAKETGIIGLISLLAFGIVIASDYLRNILRAKSSSNLCAYGLGFGLIAILIHSLSDFGQHIPANSLLSVIFCGLLVSLSKNNTESPLRVSVPAMRKIGGAVMLVSAVLVFGSFYFSLDSARRAESSWAKVMVIEKQLQEKDWQGTNNEFRELIQNASAANEHDPGNVEYAHWLNVYRWFSLTRSSSVQVSGLAASEQLAGIISRIIDQLYRTIELCPTFGPSWCVAGQLDYFVLGNPTGKELIQTGYTLAPNDPTTGFAAGYLMASNGDIEASFTKFERAVNLDGRFFNEIAQIYTSQLDRPDLAIQLAGEDVSRLNRVSAILRQDSRYDDLEEEIASRHKAALISRLDQGQVHGWVYASLAGIYSRQQQPARAIEYYKKALDLEYGQVHWRLALARQLADQGHIEDAIHEARICLRLRPDYHAAVRLIEDLSVRTDRFIPAENRVN